MAAAKTLEVQAVKGVVVGWPTRAGYVGLKLAEPSEEVLFEVQHGPRYASAGVVTVPNDRFFQRAIADGALRLAADAPAKKGK